MHPVQWPSFPEMTKASRDQTASLIKAEHMPVVQRTTQGEHPPTLTRACARMGAGVQSLQWQQLPLTACDT